MASDKMRERWNDVALLRANDIFHGWSDDQRMAFSNTTTEVQRVGIILAACRELMPKIVEDVAAILYAKCRDHQPSHDETVLTPTLTRVIKDRSRQMFDGMTPDVRQKWLSRDLEDQRWVVRSWCDDMDSLLREHVLASLREHVERYCGRDKYELNDELGAF
jgi:hypothetical protein